MAARGLRRAYCVFDARVPDPILNKLEVCPCFQEVCSDGVLKRVEVALVFGDLGQRSVLHEDGKLAA